MDTLQVRDTDMEETRPMRLVDGRLVLWHPLDPCPSARLAEPTRTDAPSSPVTPSPACEDVRDDPDATRSMCIPGGLDARRSASREARPQPPP